MHFLRFGTCSNDYSDILVYTGVHKSFINDTVTIMGPSNLNGGHDQM